MSAHKDTTHNQGLRTPALRHKWIIEDGKMSLELHWEQLFTHLSPKTPVTVQCVRYLVVLIYNIYEVYIINSGQAIWLSTTNTLPQKMIIQLLTKCYSQLPEGGEMRPFFTDSISCFLTDLYEP